MQEGRGDDEWYPFEGSLIAIVDHRASQWKRKRGMGQWTRLVFAMIHEMGAVNLAQFNKRAVN
jgi:hypothetical protein